MKITHLTKSDYTFLYGMCDMLYMLFSCSSIYKEKERSANQELSSMLLKWPVLLVTYILSILYIEISSQRTYFLTTRCGSAKIISI